MKSAEISKTISLILLCIPFILIITYTPPSIFSINNLTQNWTRWPQFMNITQHINTQITKQIQQLKFNVQTQKQQLQCNKYVAIKNHNVNGTQDKDIDKKEIEIVIGQDEVVGFCRGFTALQQQIYFHVLDYEHKEQLKTSIQQLQQRLKIQLKGTNIRIIYQKLDASTVPQHIKTKLSQQMYIKTLSSQLSLLHYNNHCRFTHKTCNNYVIYLTQWQSLKQGYFKHNNIIYTQQFTCIQTIVQLLSDNIPSISYLNRIIKIQNLLRIQKQLKNMQQLMKNYMVTVNLAYLKQYETYVLEYIQNGEIVPTSLMGIQDAVKIDMFPTQYKVGVLLPLLLILIIFPCINIIKV